ncbi:MAG: sigma-70 family RNA polymerase sigma factor [Lachnospiraceae bacterium]|nr:sigma-70 family RNA polymerase sigma factor [Lachnospiraceae bacterium]
MKQQRYYRESDDDYSKEELDYEGFVDSESEQDYLEESYLEDDFEPTDEIIPDSEDGLFGEQADDIGVYGYQAALVGKKYSTEEWIEMVHQFKNGTMEEQNEAVEKMYCSLLPFIKKIAKDNYASYMPKYMEDLESVGKIGFFNGLPDYDPEKGAPGTWFYRYIIHEMRDFIDLEVHHTTPHFYNNMRVIQGYINKCEIMGVSYTIDDIMIATGLPKQTIVNCTALYERSKNQVSTEQLFGENNISIIDTLPSKSLSPEATAIENEAREMIHKTMEDCLSQREQDILHLKYGFGDNRQMSSADIAEKLNLRKQDIRPIVNRAERKLRSTLKRNNVIANETVAKAGNAKRMTYLKSSVDFEPEYEFEDIEF